MTANSISSFSGPLFLIGLARSGTTMLREILNTHKDICIPMREYAGLSRILNNWHNYKDLSDFENFKNFYDDTANIVSIDLDKLYNRNDGIKTIDLHKWYNSCNDFGPEGVLEPLFRFHVSCTQPGGEAKRIWGDKSPQHSAHIGLLIKSFPYAKFILLFRDPRDVALSASKFSFRHYLGKIDKNTFDRAWEYMHKTGDKRLIKYVKSTSITMLKMKEDLLQNGAQYIEIKYENLLTDLTKELIRVSDFFNIDNDYDIDKFQTPVYSYGDGRGSKEILITNMQKFKKQLNPHIIKVIDEICGMELNQLGYETYLPKSTKKISSFSSKYYSLSGYINMARAMNKMLGVKNASQLIFRSVTKR